MKRIGIWGDSITYGASDNDKGGWVNRLKVSFGNDDEDIGVYNVLGYGFLECIYEKALAVEFSRRGLKFGRQVPINVCYKGESVGDYFADFLVEGEVIVEVKTVTGIGGVMRRSC